MVGPVINAMRHDGIAQVTGVVGWIDARSSRKTGREGKEYCHLCEGAALIYGAAWELVGLRGETNEDGIMDKMCYRPSDQYEEVDSLLETLKEVFVSYDAGSYRKFNICWKGTVVRSKLSRRLLDGIGNKYLIQALEEPTRMTHRWTCHSLTSNNWLGMWYSMETLAVVTTT